MRAFVLLAFLGLCSLVAVAHNGSRAEYIGGTLGTIPTNNYGDIALTDQVYFTFSSKLTHMRIPYERINLVEYGQKVDRRYLTAAIISPLFLLAKKREHFLTIGFQDDDGHQQALIFRVNKSDIRQTLVELEARTGQRVGYQDEEARKDPKG
ncbi:MAG TPA: hypothetical protein VG168_12345 [Bryobacteraceae bacterium]|jgi:hypothetical protein|nr:hypothetical protein [Bryobacteraceae bacterium]